jgi:hypothetical protein
MRMSRITGFFPLGLEETGPFPLGWATRKVWWDDDVSGHLANR